MQRINTPDGNFHAGNPATGELGTIVTKEFMQAVQDEIATAVEGAGFELDPNDNGQLLDAIKTLTQQSVSSVGMDSGAANAYVVKFTPPIENPAPWAPLWFKVANANTGPSTLDTTGSEYALVGGAHQPLQGGELVAAGNALVYWNPSLDNGHGQYVLLFCSGAAQQIAPGTQPGHALQLGQFLSQAQPLVASIAALRALPKAKYSNVTVASYNGDSVSRSLQFWQDTNDNASDENGVTVIIAADGARWKLRSSGPISPCDAGAKGNGVDDDSVALARIAALPADTRIDGRELVFVTSQPIMFANRVDVRLKLKAAATFAQGGVMATVAADNSRIDFNIDANGLALVGVKASGKSITGDVSGANIVGAPAAVGGGYQSVLLVTGDHCRIGVHGENLTYGTADNTSVPRVLSTGPVVGGKITRCTGKNVIAGFVNQAGDVSIDYLHMYKCGNNGIYDISAGGNVTIDTAIFEGDLGLNLQTVVSESLVTIDNLIVRDVYGYAAVDKAGSVIIGNYSIITTTPGKTHQVMVSRDGATSVSVRINTVSGNLWLPSQDSGGGIFQFFKGVPNQIEIGRIALDLYYQDGATKQLWVQTDGSQCVAAIDDIRLRLIDQSGKLTSSDIISMQLPTFGLASYINQIALSSATATISVSNVMQANLKPPAISELTQGNGAINSNVTGTTPRIFYMSGVPTGGTYRTGDVVKIKFPTLGKPSEYTCMGGGSPGTWTATAGTVKRGNTANRPTGLGFADAGWMYIDDQLNPNGKPIFWSGTAWIDSAGNAA